MSNVQLYTTHYARFREVMVMENTKLSDMTLEQALSKVPEALFCDRTREPLYAVATPSAICKFSDSDAFTRV